MATTVYDVQLRYMLQDRASTGMRAMQAQAKRTSDATAGLGQTLKRAGMAAAGYFGLRAATGALIGYNMSMEAAKTRTAGLLSLNIGGEFTQQLQTASNIVDELQERAKVSTATTSEMVGFMSEIVGPATQAGLASENLAEFSAQAVIAAKALNMEQTAALDIQQALLSTVSVRDKFAVQLIRYAGMELETFRQLNQEEKLAALRRGLARPELARMAEAQSKTFEGLWSTFRDLLEITLGKVGQPLFAAMSKELARWNDYLTNNQQAVESFARDLGQVVLDIGKALKALGKFVWEVKTFLLPIAKVLLVMKGLKWAAGGFPALAAFGKSLTDVSAGAWNVSGAFGKLAGNLPMLGTALMGVYEAAKLGAKAILNLQEKHLHAAQETVTLRHRAREMQEARERGDEKTERDRARLLLRRARDPGLGLFTKERALDPKAMARYQWAGGQYGMVEREIKRAVDVRFEHFFGMATTPFEMLKRAAMTYADKLKEIERAEAERKRLYDEAATKQVEAAEAILGMAMFRPGAPGRRVKETATAVGKGLKDLAQWVVRSDPTGEYAEGRRRLRRQRISVDIHKIEVQSEDPDRFVFGMIEAIKDAVRNPSSDVEAAMVR